MRKRSTQEIIEVLGVYGNPDLLKKREAEIAAKKKKDQGEKPSKTEQEISKNEKKVSIGRQDSDTRKDKQKLARDKFEYQKKKDADRIKSDSIKKQETKVKEIGSKIKPPKREKITSKDKSVTATGKAAANAIRSGVYLAKSGVAAGRKIKARMDLNKAKKAGPTVTGDVQSPTKKPASGGSNVARTAQSSSKKVQGAVSNTIKTSRIPDAVKAGRKVAGSAVKATRQVAGDAIQSASNVVRRGEPKKTVTGNRIRQAIKNVRNTAARPIQAVSNRIRPKNLKREHTSYTQFATFIEDYIHEAEKDSSKEVKKKTIDVMKGKNAVEVNPKIQAEETMSPAQKRKDTNLKKKYDDSDMKQNMIDQYGKEEGLKVYYATIRKQAMKTESVLEVQSVSDGLKFREYEFIDVIKNKPMKSPKNNITWTEERDEYGDPINKDGSYAGKKNIDKNPKDEKITRSEANMPVKGLVKLAAMVADNNKKRKNALQIQKYIGEDKKMGRQSDEALAAAHKKFSSMDQTSPANSFMTKRIQKEIDRRKKANPKPDVTTEGKGSNPNKRYIGDPIVTSKKSFSKTGKIGIDYYTDDEKKKSEKEKMKDAKDPKKNMSREKATQNMQMIKRMTPEQKYARKMRIKQQQKDKK